MIPRHDSLFQRWSVNHALPYRTVAFIVNLLRGQALHAPSHVWWWFTCKNSFDTGRKLFFDNPIEGYENLIGRIWLGHHALAQTWPFCGGAPFTHVRPQRPSAGPSKFFPVVMCAIQERDRVCDGAGDDDGDGDGLELLLHTRIAPHWFQLCCHYYPALATAANGSRTATRRWWQRTARYVYVNCFVFQLGRNSRSVAEVAIVCFWRVVCVFSVKLAFPYTNVMMHEEDAQSFTH